MNPARLYTIAHRYVPLALAGDPTAIAVLTAAGILVAVKLIKDR